MSIVSIIGVLSIARYSEEECQFETVKIDEWSIKSSCPDLPNLPFPSELAVGAMFQGNPRICGGFVHSATRFENLDII